MLVIETLVVNRLGKHGCFCSLSPRPGITSALHRPPGPSPLLTRSLGLPAFLLVLGDNTVFMAAFWAWFLAQFAKIITVFYKTGKLSGKAFLSSGKGRVEQN